MKSGIEFTHFGVATLSFSLKLLQTLASDDTWECLGLAIEARKSSVLDGFYSSNPRTTALLPTPASFNRAIFMLCCLILANNVISYYIIAQTMILGLC